MNFENLIKQDPQVNEILERELLRQQRNIELIASENIVSKAVMEAMGSYLQTSMPKDIRERDITEAACT